MSLSLSWRLYVARSCSSLCYDDLCLFSTVYATYCMTSDVQTHIFGYALPSGYYSTRDSNRRGRKCIRSLW